jgi:hypothetical protein
MSKDTYPSTAAWVLGLKLVICMRKLELISKKHYALTTAAADKQFLKLAREYDTRHE